MVFTWFVTYFQRYVSAKVRRAGTTGHVLKSAVVIRVNVTLDSRGVTVKRVYGFGFWQKSDELFHLLNNNKNKSQ